MRLSNEKIAKLARNINEITIFELNLPSIPSGWKRMRINWKNFIAIDLNAEWLNCLNEENKFSISCGCELKELSDQIVTSLLKSILKENEFSRRSTNCVIPLAWLEYDWSWNGIQRYFFNPSYVVIFIKLLEKGLEIFEIQTKSH